MYNIAIGVNMPQPLSNVSQENKLNPARQNEFIQEALRTSIKDQYPIIGTHHTLEMVGSPKIEDDLDDLDFPAQKEIKLSGKSWQIPIYATFRLRDNKTGMLIDEAKDIKIANIPKLTDRFSMLIGGNEYTTMNQFRLKSGVYARQKENGEMESFFNLAVGYNFKMELDPAEGVFYLFVAKQRFHLYALLHALGISDSEAEKAWGQELLDKNRVAGMNEVEREIPLLYEKLHRKTVGYSEALNDIKKYFDATRMDPDVTKITLGEAYDRVSPTALLSASVKLLKVMRGTEPEDERDSLLFKQLYTVDDQLKAYIEKTTDTIARNLKYRTDNKDNVREIISSDTYTEPIRKFFTTGDLSNPSPQTNPVEMASEWRKTTITGSGGIQSEHAITLKTRDVHPSHLGFIDPLHTPEGHKVGVTLSLGVGVRKRGKDLTTTIVTPDGKQKEITPIEFHDMHIGFPDQHENGKAIGPEIKMMYKGETSIAPKKEIEGYLIDPQAMFGWTTNLVPFLGNNSGNRAAVAAKMASQAVPLKNIEAPLVKVQSMSGRTMDELLGMIATTRLHQEYGVKKGEVVAVDKDYITVKDQDDKKHKIGLYNDFPLNQESFLSSTPLVKVGDKIKTGDLLARNNFTDTSGNYAYGTNATVAYMPWYGYNFEDGVVVTESMADKMTSTVIIKKSLSVASDGILEKKKFTSFFPEIIKLENLNKLNDEGIVKEGEKVQPGDILVAYLSRVELTDTERILKQMNRVISNPYRDRSLVWDGEHEGVVKYVRKVGNNVTVWIYEEQPLTVGDKLCYSEDTEILTRAGWKNVAQMDLDDEFASLSPEGNLEYVKAKAFTSYDYTGKMYNVYSTQVSLLTTPEHRHYVKLRGKEKYELLPSTEIFGKRYNLKNNAENTAPNIPYIALPAIDVKAGQFGRGKRNIPERVFNTKAFMMLTGMVISEGNTFSQPGGNFGVDITQIKHPEILTNALDEAGIKYTNNLKSNNKIRIYSKQLYNYFKPLGKCYQKYIPQELFNHSAEDLSILFKWLIWGDGHIGKTSMSYYTTSYQLAKDMQRLALHIGMAANIKIRPAGTRKFRNTIYQTRQSYVIAFYQHKNFPQINHGHIRKQKGQFEGWTDYVGKVYCPTLEKNGIVYVQRDGKPVWSGNCGRYGDKGIVTKIISDDEAPYTKDGTRIDIIFNPHGVVGRMNMGQMLETAAGKLAMKTGKPYLVKNFSDKDYLSDIMDQLKKNKIPTDEILYTKTGKPITNAPVFWGSKYYLKLMHIVEHKFKTRDIPGTYDANEQPAKGEEGGQSIDPLQMYALLAHGARQNLYEFAAVKSQKNDEYWRNLQLGFPPPPPQKNFVFDKMLAYMQAAGINIEKNGYKLRMYPATTKDVLSWSSGEIKDAGHMLRGKDLMEIEGGLFDPKLTGGGLKGKNWNHMVLAEPMPNPVFETAIQALTGLNGRQYDQVMNEELEFDGLTGTKLILKRLKAIDVNHEYAKAIKDLQSAAPSQVNTLNKRVRYLRVLKDFKLNPEDAYVMKAVPILPPLFRPIYPLPSGDLQVSPINKHYHDLSLINNQIGEVKKTGVDNKVFNKVNRVALYGTLKSLTGLSDPVTFTREKYEGLLKTLIGETPKEGFIQNKVWGKRQDLSARSTATVEPSLGLDEIGLPEPMLRSIMKPFVIRELVRQGNKPIDAIKQYREWTPLADQALNVVIKERPVLMNRAPSLHKHSVQAFYPVRFDGMSIKTNPLIVKGFGLDYDGDTISIHVPVGEAAVSEARKMVPSKNLHKAGDREHMHQFSQDYQLGLYFLTVPGKNTNKKFKTLQEANKAGLNPQDQFILNGKKTTLGKQLVNAVLPKSLQNYDAEYNSKYVKGLVEKLYQEYPNQFANVMDHFKDIGRQYAVERGSTLSLSDIAVDRTYRDKILEKYEKQMTKGMPESKKIDLYMKAKEEMVKKQDEIFSKNGNRFYDMLRSGSSSKAEPVSQILSMPGILNDLHGKPMPVPVKKSWSEGLDTFGYWNQSYGARKGVVDKSINTQESGGLNKELLFNTKNLLVVEEDCNTPEFIEVDLNGREALDRYLAKNITGVGQRNSLVTTETVQRAKHKNLETLPVRSPLTCEADGGICVKCYGLMPNGQPATIGDNVGILDAEAITERSTQLTLQTFHSGGAASAKTGIMAGFPRLKELLYVPQTIINKAVLAEEPGIVRSIVPNPVGGSDMFVDDKRYYIPRDLVIKVNIGQKVNRGDALTEGSIKPQELSKLKDHLTAQIYAANEINKIYDNKFARKSIENVIRGTSNFAELTEIPEKTPVTWLRGDTVPLTTIKKINRDLAIENKPLIKYSPVFKSIDVLPLESEDWLSRLSTNRLKQTFEEGASMGLETNLKGTDPIPAYFSGIAFGQDLNKEKKQLY